MSNMAASPGSRSLEQLKVAELRDELRKRGLNGKGVKKELFQRLTEAIEKENREGVVHGEHKLTEEIEHNMCTADDHEDVEGEEEALDGSTGEAGNSDSATVACQSNISLETPFPTVEQSTISSDGVHIIPNAIESQEVSVTNKDGEQVSSAEGADMGTYNNSMFVDNAVSGNGDTMMLCDSAGKKDDVLEPSKNISGLEHFECVNNEEGPAIVTSALAKRERIDAAGDDMCVSKEKESSIGTADLAKTERGDDVRKDGLASNVIGDVAGDDMCVPIGTADLAKIERGDDVRKDGLAINVIGDVSGDDMCVSKEKEPSIGTADLAKTERVDDVRKDGLASNVIEDVISDVAGPPIENVDPYVTNENLVGHDANENDVGVHDISNDVENSKLTDDELPKPDTAFETSFTKADEEGLVQPMEQQLDSSELVDVSHVDEVGLRMESSFVSTSHSVACQQVNEPSAGLNSEDVEGHNDNEKFVIPLEESTDVKVEQLGMYEISSAGESLISDIKVASMEIETGLECNEELDSALKMNSLTDNDDRTQLDKEVSDLVTSERAICEESNHRVRDDWAKDRDKDVKMMPMEDITQARFNLKRKDNESDAIQQEPVKRMRRWNSGKEVVADGLKPLTTDSMKEIMLPDATESTSPAAHRLTPKAVATSRPLPSKVKVEPDPSNTMRTVPPAMRAPSNSLKVERFLRPFTLKAAKDLLAEYGQCINFWMDQIKTHCYVTYSSVNEAVAARNGLYGRQWPASVGNCLVAEFVDPEEVKMRSEGLMENAQSSISASSMRVSNPTQMPPPRGSLSSPRSRNNNESMALSSPRFSRDAQLPPALKKDPEPPVVTLEDLFYKTKAKPHIYYLPLTDEQVAEKLKKQQVLR